MGDAVRGSAVVGVCCLIELLFPRKCEGHTIDEACEALYDTADCLSVTHGSR